jgi:hypothetical protein
MFENTRSVGIAVGVCSVISAIACGTDDKGGSKSGLDGGNPSSGDASTGGSTSTGGASSSGGATSTGGASASAGGAASTGGSGGGGGGTNIEGPLSCNYTDDHNCVTFSSAPPGAASSLCLSGSTPGVTCPTADLFATCTFTTSGIQEEYFYYGADNFSKAGLTTACNAESGTLVFK